MTLQVETTVETDPLTASLQAMVEQQHVSEDGFRELRHQLYRSSPLKTEQVEQICQAHRKMPPHEGLWTEFFLDALTEELLTRDGDRIYLEEDAEEQLLVILGDERPVINLGYRHLILRLLLRATDVSERHQRLALHMVHHHLLHDDRRLLVDLPRTPGMIDIVDLQLIRKLVYGAGGQYGGFVGEAVAYFLLKLDQGSFVIIDQEAWRRFYQKAMKQHTVDHVATGT